MSGETAAWPLMMGFADIGRRTPADPLKRRIILDAAQRRQVAEALGLERLDLLEANVRLSAWHDGLRIEADWRASVTQICGVSLDPFETSLEGRFSVRAVPPGSPNAPTEPTGEVEFDSEAEDPPDLLAGESLDVGAYVVEHLALEIDPFPRKPGVEFEAPDEPAPPSPFDVLRALKRD